MADTKLCPYCAEEIQSEAVRCRFCRSRLRSFATQNWHRSHPEARVAGVCAALSQSFLVPVAAVRVGFVVLTFLHLLGPLLYLILWLLILVRPGEASLVEIALERALQGVRSLRGTSPANERGQGGVPGNSERKA